MLSSGLFASKVVEQGACSANKSFVSAACTNLALRASACGALGCSANSSEALAGAYKPCSALLSKPTSSPYGL